MDALTPDTTSAEETNLLLLSKLTLSMWRSRNGQKVETDLKSDVKVRNAGDSEDAMALDIVTSDTSSADELGPPTPVASDSDSSDKYVPSKQEIW